MQVLNGTVPGVRRSKRPLLIIRIRCICLNLSEFGSKDTVGNKVQFGNDVLS